MLSFVATLLAASMAVGQSDGERVFKSYTDFAIGGVWTSSVDGEQMRHTYRKVLDGSFVQLNARGGKYPGQSMFGVDPQTNTCTCWMFGGNGGVHKFTMTQESDTSWLCEGGGSGPEGSISWKFRITRVDENTVKEEGIEVVENGVKQEPRTVTWTRQQLASKK